MEPFVLHVSLLVQIFLTLSSSSSSSSLETVKGYFGTLRPMIYTVVNTDALLTEVLDECRTLSLGEALSSRWTSAYDFIRRTILQQGWPAEKTILMPMFFPNDFTNKWYDIKQCLTMKYVESRLTMAGGQCAVTTANITESDLIKTINCSSRHPFVCYRYKRDLTGFTNYTRYLTKINRFSAGVIFSKQNNLNESFQCEETCMFQRKGCIAAEFVPFDDATSFGDCTLALINLKENLNAEVELLPLPISGSVVFVKGLDESDKVVVLENALMTKLKNFTEEDLPCTFDYGSQSPTSGDIYRATVLPTTNSSNNAREITTNSSNESTEMPTTETTLSNSAREITTTNSSNESTEMPTTATNSSNNAREITTNSSNNATEVQSNSSNIATEIPTINSSNNETGTPTINSLSTATEFSTTKSSNRHGLCVCHCDNSSRHNNAKDLPTIPGKNLQTRLEEIKILLTVNKNNLSSTTRTKESAWDIRTSSQVIGSVGVFVLFALFCIIFISDIFLLVKQLRRRTCEHDPSTKCTVTNA